MCNVSLTGLPGRGKAGTVVALYEKGVGSLREHHLYVERETVWRVVTKVKVLKFSQAFSEESPHAHVILFVLAL